MINKIYNEDCLETMARMEDKSVDCVITSPPYWQLRDYGWTGQWGLEKTYQEYLEHLWSLMDKIYRVLKDEGTVWINLGDSYSTVSGGMAGGEWGRQGLTGKIEKIKQAKTEIPAKCLLLIPHRFAIGCIDRGWILRNDIIWAKRNGMPESVRDRFSKKHEFIFFFVKQQKYYFDLDGVRTPYSQELDRWGGNHKRRAINEKTDPAGFANANSLARAGRDMRPNESGKNPGDVSDFWDVPTQPSSEKHYATFNTDLIDKPIVAGCPKDGVILDPFCGTGTTLARAIQLDRNAIGIDGKQEYCDIANKRIEQELAQLKLAL